MYNILIGGAAGQGIETTAEVLEKMLKEAGYYVLSIRDIMSRVRGGHNFISIRFGSGVVNSHSKSFDVIIAMNEETIEVHKDELSKDGIIICDSKLESKESVYEIPMSKMAQEIGNARVAGIIAAGAVLKWFQIPTDGAKHILEQMIKKEFVDLNYQALQKGMESIESKFEPLKGTLKDGLILSGSEAVGLGAIAAGVNFYSAYPMSPSTAVMEYLASVGEKAGIVVEQAEDEIAGINMAIGASYAGARAMTGTSGGGFCLKVEGLGFAGIAEIPIVIIDVMRPGPATGLPTRTEQADLKFVISASQGEFPRIVLSIRDHQDAVYQTFRAFQLAEKYQIPVILLSDQYLGDSHATIPMIDFSGAKNVLPDTTFEGTEYLRYELTESGISKRLIPGKAKAFVNVDSDEHDEKGWIIESAEERIAMADKRSRKMQGVEDDLLEPQLYGEEKGKTLLIGWGSTSGPIKEAVDLLNEKEPESYMALLFNDVYPLPTDLLEKYASGADTIVNVEQNATGQFADLIRQETGITMDQSILKYDGRQISGEEIVKHLKEEV